MPTIFVFGASTSYGCWDPDGGWVQKLRKVVDIKNLERDANNPEPWWERYSLLYNMGVPGDTTSTLLERFETELEYRIDKEDEEVGCVIIFQLGLNDSMFDSKTRHPEISPSKFQENLEKLISVAKKHTSEIAFIGTLPVDEARVDPIPWMEDFSYKNELVEEYNEITKSVCRISGVHFVDIFQRFIGSDYQKLLEDGVHGNSEGHQKIFEAVKDYLIENKVLDL